jgi:hypothetical protein
MTEQARDGDGKFANGSGGSAPHSDEAMSAARFRAKDADLAARSAGHAGRQAARDNAEAANRELSEMQTANRKHEEASSGIGLRILAMAAERFGEDSPQYANTKARYSL